MDRKQIPKPGFLDDCEYLGYVNGDRRWRSPEGDRLFTWDWVHGEIEAFDVRGRHFGVFDGVTGEQIKLGRRGRRIRV